MTLIRFFLYIRPFNANVDKAIEVIKKAGCLDINWRKTHWGGFIVTARVWNRAHAFFTRSMLWNEFGVTAADADLPEKEEEEEKGASNA